MKPFHRFVQRLVFGLALTTFVAGAFANPSNKWRLQFSGKANSDGEIVLHLTAPNEQPFVAHIAVKDNTGENGVAKTVVKALKVQLPEDRFHIERDDGEDVLIKKRRGTPDFDVEIVSNTVDGVHINPDRE
jgi:hypothetical protein